MAKRPTNILMFAVDSLRRDRLSCYGYGRATSPHIDRLAAGGVLFENMFSPYVPTTPGYSTMLTGRDVMATGQVCLGAKHPLHKDQPTLPEILREHGYVSTCIGFDGGFYRGFDNYETYEGWGDWEHRPLRKAENLNEKAIPALEELAGEPFLLFLRHMDPHSPYLPPGPFDQMFYSGDPCAKGNKSMAPVFAFKPFADYFASWMPPRVTDINWVLAMYDSEIAYMDACIARILTRLNELGLAEDTLVVVTSDHGETLDEHDCYFDHHGTYEPTLMVPLILYQPGNPQLPAGLRPKNYVLLEDVVPTLLDLLGFKKDLRSVEFDGRSAMPLVRGERANWRSEFYITECTWMRKRGWRTPQWKLIDALEPDFHHKPPVELYNLIEDPLELSNLAKKQPEVVKYLKERMLRWVEKRLKETGKPDPIMQCEVGLDKRIGTVGTAKKLQAR